jgi:hypothetical protein
MKTTLGTLSTLVLTALLTLAGANAASSRQLGAPIASSSPPLTVLAGSPGDLRSLTATGKTTRLALPTGVAGLAAGDPGVVLLLPPVKEPPLADLGLVALRLAPETGTLQLLSLDFTTPHEGSMFTGDGFTELEAVVGAFGGTPFALDAFHGGGVGAVFGIGEAGLLPDPAYRLPPTGDVTLEGSMPEPGSPACSPPVLALLPHGVFLVRGQKPVGEGFACRYFLLAPGGRLTPLPRLDAFTARHAGLAAAGHGTELALLTAGGDVYLGEADGPWRLAAKLPPPAPWSYGEPAGVAYSPRGDRLVATLGGRVVLWRTARGRLSPVTRMTLPPGTTSWLPLFTAKTRLPKASVIAALLRKARDLAVRAAVTVTGRAAPTVRILRRTAQGSACVPLIGWDDMFRPAAGSLDGCPVGAADGSPFPDIASNKDYLVSPGPHPGSFSALAQVAKTAWVLIPAAGWFPLGTTTIRITTGGRTAVASVTVGGGP